MKKAFIIALSLWAHQAVAATCSDIGYYCPAYGRYQRVQYIEMTGGPYLDTGIALNSKYDMEMTWQNTKFIHDKWATGIWTAYGNPAIYMTGMWQSSSGGVSVSMYNIRVNKDTGENQVRIPFDTDIHTTYCYKDKGIWIDDESTLAPVDYEASFPSDKNFLVGARQGTAQPSYHWTGRVYSFIFKDNGQIMAEFIPVYDTETKKYGMLDTISNTFHGNLGSGAFTGGEFTNDSFPCTNAPEHAHYTGSGTDNNCPWECDNGYARTSLEKCAELCSVIKKLHIGTKSFNIYATRQTHPTLVLQHKNETCYINTLPGRAAGTANINLGNDSFHVAN